MPRMRSVGLFQAKNGLSALVERVSKGEEIMITRRGQNVAMLVPASRRSRRATPWNLCCSGPKTAPC